MVDQSNTNTPEIAYFFFCPQQQKATFRGTALPNGLLVESGGACVFIHFILERTDSWREGRVGLHMQQLPSKRVCHNIPNVHLLPWRQTRAGWGPVLMSRPSSAELQLTSNEAPRPKAPNSINCVSAPAVLALIYLHKPTVPGRLDQTPEIVLTWWRPMFWGWELCVAHYCGPLSVMSDVPENSFQMLKKCQKIGKAKTEMIRSCLFCFFSGVWSTTRSPLQVFFYRITKWSALAIHFQSQLLMLIESCLVHHFPCSGVAVIHTCPGRMSWHQPCLMETRSGVSKRLANFQPTNFGRFVYSSFKH